MSNEIKNTKVKLEHLYYIQYKKLRGIPTNYRETKIHESIFDVGIQQTLILIQQNKL